MIRSRMTKLLTAAVVVGVFTALVPPPLAMAAVPGRSPFPRTEPAMAYDAADGQVVLFGGSSFNSLFGDTWTWDGTDWTRQTPAHSPSPQNGMAMAYDAAHGQVVLFGGHDDQNFLGDTWTWDGTDWTRRTPAHSPSPRGDIAMAYDAADGRIVLFGGEDDTTLHADTWTWDGTDWTRRTPLHSPPVRSETAMAYDAADGQVVLFGGFTDGSNFIGDTWTWDGTDWTQRTPARSPPRRYALAMSGDAGNHVVLFGGRGDSGGDFGILGDTWTWDGTDWTQASPAHAPQPRDAMGMAYDSAQKTVTMFGGYDVYHLYDDTWTWDGTDWSKHPSGWISLNPRSGQPGTSVRVKGRGFTAFEFVKLSFADSIQGRIFLNKNVRTDESGRFKVLVTIPANATPGIQHVKAMGPPGTEIAKRGFTVT